MVRSRRDLIFLSFLYLSQALCIYIRSFIIALSMHLLHGPRRSQIPMQVGGADS